MLLTEYDEIEQMELFKEDGHKEGLKGGRKEGMLETLASPVRDGILTVKDAASRAGMSESAFQSSLGLKQ